MQVNDIRVFLVKEAFMPKQYQAIGKFEGLKVTLHVDPFVKNYCFTAQTSTIPSETKGGRRTSSIGRK